MKSFKKSIVTGETELAAQHDKLSQINIALINFARDMFGVEDLDSLLRTSDASVWSDKEQRQMYAEIKAERTRVLKQIEEENIVAKEALRDIENVK